MGEKEKSLELKTRRIIFKHILKNPGLHERELARQLNIALSTIDYHLYYLRRAKRITSNIESGKLHYYPYSNNTNISNPMNATLKIQELTPHQEHILSAIKQNTGINQTELIAKTSLKRHILSYNISKLIHLGIVRKTSHEKNVCYDYIPDELLEYEMLKILTIKLLNNELKN